MKTWSVSKADQIFSELIRKRDPICVRCEQKQSSDCSHYFERGHFTTRFHPQNCDGVCRECHMYWHAHRSEYRQFKIDQLGTRAFVDLQRLSALTSKQDIEIMKLMKLII